MDHREVVAAFATTVLAICCSLSAQTQTRILPASVDELTEGSGSTVAPFGWDGIGTTPQSPRVQYVYDSSNFEGESAILSITGIRFRANTASTTRSGPGGLWGNCTIRLGACAVDYRSISNVFATNWPGGVDPVPNFSGPVAVMPWSGNSAGATGDWYVDINFTRPAIYDPRQGDDFIVDVANSGNFTGLLPDLSVSDEDQQNPRCTRLLARCFADITGNVSGVDRGIVCELTYTRMPQLTANFTVDQPLAGPGEMVTFRDTSYSSHPIGVVAWMWDFDGDGLADRQTQNPTWAYPTCGVFPVSLTVVDSTGTAMITRSMAIEVGAPAASFEVDWSGVRPVVAQFRDTSAGRPTSWAWDFDGDGVVDSTQQNPTHNFRSLGSYRVSLDVSNACGMDSATEVFDFVPRLQSGDYDNAPTGTTSFTHSFDVDVLNPAGITLTDIGVLSNQLGGTPIAVEVYTRTGGFTGFDGNRAAWQLAGRLSGPASGGFSNESTFDLPDVFLPQGRHGVTVAYTSGGPRFSYTRRQGARFANPDLAVEMGVMRTTPFGGSRFEGRVWLGALYYCEGSGNGTLASRTAGCVGTNGQVPQLAPQGGIAPSIGTDFVLDLSAAPANQALSFVIIGVGETGGLSLAAIGMPGCALVPQFLLSIPAPTNASGAASATLAIADNLDTIGFPLFAQALIADPGANALGAVVTDGVAATIGCR